MSDSEIGVLKHLAAPKASVTPWVALNTPPFFPPTSSPKTTVSSWADMTSWIARLTAVMRLTSRPCGCGSGVVTAGPGFDHLGIDVAVGIVGGGGSLGLLDGRRDRGNDVLFDADFIGFGEEALLDQVLLERDDRVVPAANPRPPRGMR